MSFNTIPDPEDIKLLRQVLKTENRTKMLIELRRKLVELSIMKTVHMDGEAECIRYVDEHPDLTNEPIVMLIFGVLYLHIFVLGLIGNIAILYLTLRNRHLQTVQNIFILNLAIGDVLMCLTSLPITPVTNVYKTWFFASPVCKLIPLVQGASILVSTFSLCAIALDRYNLVVRPHKHPLNPRRASLVALCLWIMSVIVCMPYGWYMDVVEIDGLCGEYCTERWPLPEVRKGYALTVLLLQFLFPFAIMAICYYTIFARLRERADAKLKKLTERSQLLENSTVNGNLVIEEECKVSLEDKQRSNVIAQQRRTTMILASMVLIFGAIWLPHNVITLIIEYNEGFFHDSRMDHTYLASMIAHLISMSTNVINPILYAWLNPSFKEILLKTIRRKPKVQSKMPINTVIRIAAPRAIAVERSV